MQNDCSEFKQIQRTSRVMFVMLLLGLLALFGDSYIKNEIILSRMESESYAIVAMETCSFPQDYGKIMVQFEDGSVKTVKVSLSTYAEIASDHQPYLDEF